MTTLAEVRNAADELSTEERAGLVAHLLSTFPFPPPGADEKEVDRREAELDAGTATALTHREFLAAIGKK